MKILMLDTTRNGLDFALEHLLSEMGLRNGIEVNNIGGSSLPCVRCRRLQASTKAAAAPQKTVVTAETTSIGAILDIS